MLLLVVDCPKVEYETKDILLFSDIVELGRIDISGADGGDITGEVDDCRYRSSAF